MAEGMNRMERACSHLMLLLPVVAAACEQPKVPNPQLVQLDSVQLAETDSLFIGQANGFIAAYDGSFLVADQKVATVHHFGPDGERMRGFGRPGSGPGELPSSPSAIALDGSDQLVVLAGIGQFHAFTFPGAEYVRTTRGPGGFINSITVRNGSVYLRRSNLEKRTTIGVLDLATGSLRQGGPFPPPLDQFPILTEMAFAQIAPLAGDSIAITLQTSDALYLGTMSDTTFRAIPMARLNREGSRPDILEKLARDPQSVGLDVYKPSLPMALVRLSSGNFAYVSADLSLLERRFVGTLYLSVINPRTKETCPDAAIPGPTDPRPWAAFRGDTLFVLTQELNGTDAVPRIRTYAVDTSNCAWVKT